jgi:aminoglycoside 6'-N-acetyltransferase
MNLEAYLSKRREPDRSPGPSLTIRCVEVVVDRLAPSSRSWPAPTASARGQIPSTTVELDYRPLQREDFPCLQAWLAAPHVKEWWLEPSDLGSIEHRYGPVIDSVDPTEVFVVWLRGDAIGLVQRYLLDENPEWKRALAPARVPEPAAGIDYLIGVQQLTGQGLGPAMISAFVGDTWQRYPEVVAVAVAVDQRNRPSWRALEKTGFHRTWAGVLDSEDPSDRDPSFLYVLPRPSGLLSEPGTPN